MRLLLRLAEDDGSYRDLRAEVTDDVTVGELADHLAGIAGAAPSGGIRTLEAHDVTAGVRACASKPPRLLDPSETVAAAGPASGSTVRVVPARTGTTEEAPPSPVWVVGPDGSASALRYGSTPIDGAELRVSDTVELRATAAVTPSVNGERILGVRRLVDGDLVRSGSTVATIRIDSPPRPPTTTGPHRVVQRSPALRGRHDAAPIELPDPPAAVRMPGLPVLSAVVPLLMGAVLWFLTRSMTSVALIMFSFVFVVASGVESRRESRAERRFREAEFRTDLEDRRERALRARRAEARAAAMEAPSTAEVVAWAATEHGGRRWERTPGRTGACRFVVRVGRAPQRAADQITVPTRGRRDLIAAAEELAAALELHEMALAVDLGASGGLAVVGDGEGPTETARAVVAQLVGLIGPDHLALHVLTSAERAPAWRWCNWLPHRQQPVGATALLVVVDGAAPDELDELLRATASPAVVVWTSPTTDGLPAGVRAVLDTGGPGTTARLTLLDADGAVWARTADVVVEELSLDEAVPFARALAPLVPAGTGPAALPRRLGMGELVELTTGVRWDIGARTAGLGAPLGRVGHGLLNVDLRADGPHALVAGTTGSGKSELLRSLVASLALHHSPERLTFLLVDYKGGAAFGPMVSLPHTVGLVTDLNGTLARRVLRSLRAEVRHREAILAELAVADLAELDKRDLPGRPPALAIVVDEFAALVRELPEFVDGLVDLAQRGRSLGIHLVLATQRPAGVITDAIRANTALRIALRVADEDDSRDVVDCDSAAHLPRDVPGRAVVRLGPRRSAEVQIAWSGTPAGPAAPTRIRCSSLSHPVDDQAPDDAAGPTELDLVVDQLRRAAVEHGIEPPRRPWLDPLPAVIALDDVPAADPHMGGPCIGWVDRPDEQRRDPLVLQLDRDGGAMVLGASGSGRTTTLITVAAALRRAGACAAPPAVHLIDAAGSVARHDLGDFDDVVPAHDLERTLRLLRATASILDDRGDPDAPAADRPVRVVMVDGFSAFEELHERVNRGEAAELLTRIARHGRALGVHVVITARRRSEVPAALAASLGATIQLRCGDVDEAVLAGLPADVADEDAPPGRGHLRGDTVQLAMAATATDLGDAAETVPVLPRRVFRGAIPSPGPDAGWTVAVGLDAERLGPALLDMSHHHAVVAGPPRSGVSTALHTIAQGAEHAVFLSSRDDDTADGEATWSESIDAALRHARDGERTVLALDHFPELVDIAGHVLEERVAELLRDRTVPTLRIVVGGEIDAMLRCYSDVLTTLRTGRTGVLLCPDPDLHPTLLHASLPLRQELPACPGRGWVIGPGQAVPAQLAIPDPL